VFFSAYAYFKHTADQWGQKVLFHRSKELNTNISEAYLTV